MVKPRYLQPAVESLCFTSHKMGFISGPRQVGKTTLAKTLLKGRGIGNYFNWDEKTFRKKWALAPANLAEEIADDSKTPLLVLDEIHKAKSWKRDLKGLYDTLKFPIDILVTGSARLNVYRRSSDSLLGRYYHFRLHPFSLAELTGKTIIKESETLISDLKNSRLLSFSKSKKVLEDLLLWGPFPEPLLEKNKKQLLLWQKNRVERLIREDLRDLSRIQELSQIEMLVSLLPDRAAGILSITALREDLEVAYATMKLWVNYLKELYYLFEIKPFSESIPRSLKKEGKFYLWDWSEIENEGARFENLIASHLLKYANYLTDSGESHVDLHYLKNKQKQEIDFLLVKNNQPWLPIEAKLNDTTPSTHWPIFLKNLGCDFGVQVVQKEGVHRIVQVPGGEILVVSASQFLSFLI